MSYAFFFSYAPGELGDPNKRVDALLLELFVAFSFGMAGSVLGELLFGRLMNLERGIGASIWRAVFCGYVATIIWAPLWAPILGVQTSSIGDPELRSRLQWYRLAMTVGTGTAAGAWLNGWVLPWLQAKVVRWITPKVRR